MDAAGRGRGMDSDNTRFGPSGLEGEAPHRGTLTTGRQADPEWLCQSVLNQLVHDSTVIRCHLAKCLPVLSHRMTQTLHPTRRMCLRVGCHAMNGGPRACSWQLFVVVIVTLLLHPVKRFQNVSPVHAAVLHVPAMDQLYSIFFSLAAEPLFVYSRLSSLYLELRRTVRVQQQQKTGFLSLKTCHSLYNSPKGLLS